MVDGMSRGPASPGRTWVDIRGVMRGSTFVMQEAHPNGERWLEIDDQHVWDLEDME